MDWVLLSLLAGFIYAFVSILDRFLLTKWIGRPIVYLMILGVTNAAIALVMLATGTIGPIGSPDLGYALLAGLFYAALNYFYFVAVSTEEITRVAPLVYIAPVFIAIASFFLLGENLGLQEYAGVAAIVAGSILISSKNGIKLVPSEALVLMVLCCLCMTGMFLATKAALAGTGYWTVFFYARVGAVLVVLPILGSKFGELVETWRKLGKNILLAPLAEVGNTTAILCVTAAMVTGPATLVDSLASVQLIFVLAFALILSHFKPGFIDEGLDMKTLAMKLASALLIMAGVYMVS